MLDRSPKTLWETALGQLELQVTRPNFETWLRNTTGLHLEEGRFVVGVPSDFTIEWLRSRLDSLICRIVSQLAGQPVSVTFQVLGAPPAPPLPADTDARPASSVTTPPPNLNPRFTFESFTVVKGNRLAYRAARRIAAGDPACNPLTIFGSPGLGKTHLLHAIGYHAFCEQRPVVALTAEAFVDRYGQSVRTGRPHTFRDLFHECHVLLLDDLQFLATRPASQEQFFHIFNALHERGCVLAVSMDVPPQTLTSLSQPLRSRLLGGLTVELLPLSAEERLQILQAKASRLRRPLSADILKLIAEQPYRSIRELDGAINRILAYADLGNTELSVEAAEHALHPLHPRPSQPQPSAILDAVSHHFHLPLHQISGPSRARDITFARHIAMYLLRHHTSQPLTSIGQLLGGRDHTTVLSGYRRIEHELQSLPQTRTTIDEIESSLQEHPAA